MLQLTTERHEDLRTRLYVINQLLDRKIALSAFKQASDQLQEMASTPPRPRPVQPVRERVQVTAPAKEEAGKDPSSILTSIKSFFRKKEQQKERTRIISMDVEKEEPGRKEIYKEDGIYGAAQELAMLALVVSDAPPPRKPQAKRAIITGKASFVARDLSSTISSVPVKPKPKAATPERRDIAQTPEEIRRKLEARKNQSSNQGKAVFGASDIKGGQNQTVNQDPTPGKITLQDIKPQPAKGKAVFESRDVQAIATDPQKIKEKLADSGESEEARDKQKSSSKEEK